MLIFLFGVMILSEFTYLDKESNTYQSVHFPLFWVSSFYICISDKIYYLLLGDVAYFVLILFLNFGAYGIDWQRILLDGNRLYYDPTFACIIAAVIVVITFIIQTLL